MCGIAGVWHKDGEPVDPGLLRSMTDSLAHRGPDGSGVHIEQGFGLGHRRLGVIDLAGGAQPLVNEDGTVRVSFNGEIYNFQELRRDLESKGHCFRTDSDTEVLVHLYEEAGVEMCSHLQGMFAFALWDRSRQRLLLARDRLGQKPLYVCEHGRRIGFASELKSLIRLPWVGRDIRPEAVDAYLTFGYVPAPITIFRGIDKLLPGQILVADREGSWRRRYWQLRFPSEPVRESAGEALGRFETTLQEAVACRLVADVPLGAFLSGGIDSSLVVAAMQRQTDAPVRTVTIGFRGTDADEATHAALVARELNTRHRRVDVTPDAAALPAITAHFDEPFADPSAMPTYWLSEAARQTVTVALSGDGGDEAFGGYCPRYPAHLLEEKARRILGGARGAMAALGAVWPRSGSLPRWLRAGTVLENLGRDPAAAYLHDVSRLRPERRHRLLGPDRATRWADDWFRELFVEADRAGAADPLARLMFVDSRSFLSEGVLVKVDRMSMAHGLEVRSPLLDHRMYEFAAGLAPELKLRAFRGKLLLRRSLESVLPRRITRRPKKGFDPPRRSWLLGGLRPLMEAALQDSSSGLTGLVDRREARSVWSDFVAGGRDESPLMWTLLCLDLWHRSVREERPRLELLEGRVGGGRVSRVAGTGG